MRRTNINAVLKMVRLYHEDQIERIDMELDFPYEIEKRYSDDCEYAELIDDRLLDDGVIKGEDLSDEEFRELINLQYENVLDIAKGGLA